MADLNEIKDINADLPLTNFPDEIDELESFSDADDEINSAIITYKNLMKQGETAKAEELYEKYSLKKYIVSAYFLNKIQHMIIACERSISSVKKYFSFSTDAPTGTTSQPNGYLWGKVLQAGDYFKKVILKLKENGNYVDIFPRTTADNVLMSETEEETVKDRLENLGNSLNDVIDNKMDKENPVGSGKMLMNVSKTSDDYGTNAVALGYNNSPNGVNSVAIGKDCVIDDQGAIGIGRGLISSSPYQHIYETDIVRLDASHASDGYILVTYKGTNEKVKFQIQAPDGITYTYLVSETGSAIVYPLTGGNGDYLFTLFESVDVEENLYAIVFTQTANVQLSDEFLPFLTPNVYVWFTPGSPSVAAGMELAKNCHTDLEVIGEIYKHVTGTISYDTEKAADVTYGYIPNPDQTLELKKGICFDYASLMATMLRSQRIPTKLEVGYAGEVYHAWISCYVEEIGWVDGIIQFDGEHWSLMDPTLAANNDSKAVEAYIGDGSKYTVKYTYQKRGLIYASDI